ncbi:MAG: hypothetical protein A3I24_00835 [Candidatus Harrisonbacteria bacterium RIFCSPLOWO2_02_FULL_41_13b]|uniref:Uncharacterized protein n=1 Tax=Candidatus Harrisonbacteria bacterium RIFCSPLOWO2_02_FULL_41_13b TaxID=1798409 RepID=A0A1G1ZTW1_9BACT|nr:MAG: hypothetical protein A3I24_00835 [Candidatus Harrisonbacteria bacterium RIFCSPLOWO2_02_FULL_41_13b]
MKKYTKKPVVIVWSDDSDAARHLIKDLRENGFRIRKIFSLVTEPVAHTEKGRWYMGYREIRSMLCP